MEHVTIRACVSTDRTRVWYVSLYRPIKRGKVSVRTYVRNGGRGQLSSRCRHDQSDVIMRTGAASATGARRHNENDVTMTKAGLRRYGDWQHVATGCSSDIIHRQGANTLAVLTSSYRVK